MSLNDCIIHYNIRILLFRCIKCCEVSGQNGMNTEQVLKIFKINRDFVYRSSASASYQYYKAFFNVRYGEQVLTKSVILYFIISFPLSVLKE